MKNNLFRRLLSLLLCTMLVAGIAWVAAGCKNNTTPAGTSEATAPAQTTAAGTDGAATEVGQGDVSFPFTVTDADGNETAFTVKTSQTTVGAALLDAGLIAGDQGDYGLYVKTVNGITLDYDTDGMYWAFYVDGAYASASVDLTDIAQGSVYAFKAEK